MSETVVLDASAILAVLRNERGRDIVQPLMTRARVSSVNLIEILTRLVDLGAPPRIAYTDVSGLGLTIEPVDADLAFEAANLRPLTRAFGLSLGDRACLALARRLQVPVYTADRLWAELNLGIKIVVIR
jgi:ribonuclease VapC